MDDSVSTSRPSRAVSLAVSGTLVAVWGLIRLVLFPTSVLPLTYTVPLLVCVWTRDRIALWSMATIFVAFHTAKIFWLMPEGFFTPDEAWANYGATFANITVGAAAVHVIILLRERLERALVSVRAQADELRAQSEELAQQNEELAAQTEELSHQAEELSQQGEELASQNEELQSQAEEIGSVNEALERREALLHALLDTTRATGTEHAALHQIAMASLDLFAGVANTVAVYESDGDRLVVRATASAREGAGLAAGEATEDGLARIVIREHRTASLADTALRPDLVIPALSAGRPPRAVLCAPLRIGGQTTSGAFVLYSPQPHEWTADEFRMAEWLAAQCGRMLQVLRAQVELRDADRRKSEFLATLSHELRNPLGAMASAMQLYEATGGQDPKAIEITRRQLRQLMRLVDDLLDATRLTSNKIQIRRSRMDLVQIVRDVLEASRPDIEAAGHAAMVQLPATPIWIDADADRIAQVVSNTLLNAIRYTPRGGRITVTVRTRASRAVLSIADTGVGLAPGDRERIFDMFTQIEGPGSGGLGIGLALVRGIVAVHDGTVEARSDGPRRGTEIVIELPLAPADASVPAATAMAAVAPDAPISRRVLVVDDNTDSAEMMGALLQLHGHHVHIAHTAEHALTAARQFAPDVALLDIGLPDLSGYELAQKLRDDAATRHVRLVALTGWGQESDRTRATAAGFDAHLTKPADTTLVLAAIQPHLPGRAGVTRDI